MIGTACIIRVTEALLVRPVERRCSSIIHCHTIEMSSIAKVVNMQELILSSVFDYSLLRNVIFLVSIILYELP